MSDQKHYILTQRAEDDLREAKKWSQNRWGKKLTQEYFNDLHQAAQYAAMNHRALKNREDLTGDTGLSIHAIREHYLIYIPITDEYIIIAAVIRQSRDVPTILSKASFMIQREVINIQARIKRGELLLP